jgi:16S rRNA G966 N2-methylase RsmD
VLDPFAGSGTTGEVAVSMGLKAILIESSKLAQAALQDRIRRCTQITQGFTLGFVPSALQASFPNQPEGLKE